MCTLPLPKNKILRELSPLSTNDCMYVIERKKREFTFPIHTHSEYELNYIENATGAQRIVGDSIETIDNYDLVLITGDNLEHAWLNHACQSTNIREITIQFSPLLFGDGLFSKNQFKTIEKMFIDARKGLSFPLSTILHVRSLLNSLTREDSGFYSVVNFLQLLYELSLCEDRKILSSTSFAQSNLATGSDRITKVDSYLRANYQRDIKIAEVAQLVNMHEVTFSRFFKLRSGKTFTDYVTDLRIGYVIRLLVDSNKTIAEICYDCGFKNISNFNRMFKKKKGCSPKEFREMYKKRCVIF